MSPANPLAALARELLPAYADRIRFQTAPREAGRDLFSLEADGAALVVGGTDRIAQAAGLRHYLNAFCGCHVSWTGDQLRAPAKMPLPERPVRQTLPFPLRPYFNFCTFGYTTVWWDWAQWKREIDRMALNGVNLPLTVVGVEMVWYRTWRRLGLTELEARSFLSGPAFLPWQWMDNMDSHAGPIPMEWLESHATLGRRIADYQRAWGMKAIMPCFSGHVPKAWAERHPEAAIQAGSEGWFGFEPVRMLDPTDPRFAEVLATFIEELDAVLGSDHYYAIDLFHEQALPTDDPDYPRQVGAGTAAALLAADPQATWVMQAWTERRGIIEAIPKEHLLILDIGKDRLLATDGLYGYSAVWGRINNFGGQTKIQGSMAEIPAVLESVRQRFGNLAGVGAFPENLIAAEPFFALLFDAALTVETIDVEPWMHAHMIQRYGGDHPAAWSAWRRLLHEVYTRPRGDDLMLARPSLHVTRGNAWIELAGIAESEPLFDIWGNLLKAHDVFGGADGYRFDVVDVGRQALGTLSRPVYRRLVAAFFARDREGFEQAAEELVRLMRDCEALLAHRAEFRLDRWVADARRWGGTPALKAYYERQARLQVTLWGPEGKPGGLSDYACREWHGLIGGYYRPRWELFLAMLRGKLESGERYDDAGVPMEWDRPVWRATPFQETMYQEEERFVRQSSPDGPLEPIPDGVIETAQRLHDAYAPKVASWIAAARAIGEPETRARATPAADHTGLETVANAKPDAG